MCYVIRCRGKIFIKHEIDLLIELTRNTILIPIFQKDEPMDLANYHGEAGGLDEVGGNNEMMEFALRRLERFFGIDRSQAYNAWVHPSSYAETVNDFQPIFAFICLDILLTKRFLCSCFFSRLSLMS